MPDLEHVPMLMCSWRRGFVSSAGLFENFLNWLIIPIKRLKSDKLWKVGMSPVAYGTDQRQLDTRV